MWEAWFNKIVDVIPSSVMCNTEAFDCYISQHMPDQIRSVYDRQNLFTVYVHPPAGQPEFQEGSIFWQREIKERHVV